MSRRARRAQLTQSRSAQPPAPRTVLVTGASSGIGRASAYLLAEQGASLALVARSEASLVEAAEECLARGAADVRVVVADVGDEGDVAEAFAATVADLGRVDAVIHAAAVLAYGRFEDVPAQVFNRTLITNVVGTANVSRTALQQFRQQGHGSLVIVGSVLGKIVAPLMSPYAASKWAVHALVRSLQVEFRRTPGIGISLISPGGVNTPIYDLAGSYTGHAGHPPPPVYSPEVVALRVVAALDEPVRDRGVGFANPLLVLGFRRLPGLYDAVIGPLMALLGQGRASVPPHAGNVLDPTPALHAVRGRWPRVWG